MADTKQHPPVAGLPIEYATPPGLPSDVDVERAIVRLTPAYSTTLPIVPTSGASRAQP